MSFINNQSFSYELKIVTIDSPQHEILHQKTERIKADEIALGREIGSKLIQALAPYFPAAGLAAPQIGISKSVFIYSYDRNPDHLEIVINPDFAPIGDDTLEGWEGCLSVMESDGIWKLAKVPRYEKIEVSYLNANGELVQKVLDGFAAKVFQHEYDHLQGIKNIDRDDAQVKSFASRKELESFLMEVKKLDSARYKKPD